MVKALPVMYTCAGIEISDETLIRDNGAHIEVRLIPVARGQTLKP